MEESEAYSLIGDEGIHRLVAAFYRRVRQDDILGPMYPSADLSGAEQRLRHFLMFRFGGVPHYLETRGHPRLRARHMPFSIGEKARDRWLELMKAAFREAELPAEVEPVLFEYFESTAAFLMNQAPESQK